MSEAENIYFEAAKKEIKRMISMQDREPFSLTYGSFDRNYWSWKFVDFPGARFQEGVYAMAYLYSRPILGNEYFNSAKLLEWIRAAMSYWRSIQYKDGCFDEAYPFEHSLAATAFTGFYMAEAYLLLENTLSESDKTAMREAFTRAGNWLCENDEYHGFLSNHLAVAAASLYLFQTITGEEQFLNRCEYFVKKIIDHQSSEGWYEEYGGADPGYQTHGMFYLARLWQLSRNEDLLESLANATGFLKYCIHPDGTLGGEYGSRNTEFYFPAGFEILSASIPAAADIACFMRNSVKNQRAAGLAAMDAYNFFPLLNNYLFANEHFYSNEHKVELPFMHKQEKEFSEAGIYIKSNESYYAVCGISKGATLRVHNQSDGSLAFQESGYWAKTPDGTVISSQNYDKNLRAEKHGDTMTAHTGFYKVGRRVMKPWVFLGFRLFSLTLGRIKEAAYFLKNVLVKVLIHKKKPYPLFLERKIIFQPAEVKIEDKITKNGEIQITQLFRGSKFATIHMGSSRYFQEQEIFGAEEDVSDMHVALMRDGSVKRERIWKPTANENQEIL